MKHNPYLTNLDPCVFDIETTGLYPVHDRVISASFCDPRSGALRQFFCEKPAEEPLIIRDILDELSKHDAVIGYNSRRFDLPFVLTRAKKYGISSELPRFWSIDLYLWLKKYWVLATTMESLSQKSVEFALGLSDTRTDEIGGAECISLYARYFETGDRSAKEKILLHNGDDVRQLAAIGNACSFLPYHTIAMEQGFWLPYAGGILIDEIRAESGRLTAKGTCGKGMIPADIYGENYHYSYDTVSGKFLLSIDLERTDAVSYTDLDLLPVDPSDFAQLRGYQSGYLMVSEGKELFCREICALFSAILKRIV